MAAAFGWGALGGSALLVGALIAYLLAPSRRVIAMVMALGTGLLIGSVSFELVEEALETQTVAWVALLVLVGAGVFAVGDWLLTRRGGGERKDATGEQAEGSPLAIVLGSVLDGIPESFVLGLTVLQGGVNLSLLAGVILSNLPEGMSSSSGLKAAGWPPDYVVDPHRSSTTSWPSSSSGAESPMKVTLSAAPGFARFSWLVVIRSGLALAHASAATVIAIAGCGLLLQDGLALRRLWGASSRAP